MAKSRGREKTKDEKRKLKLKQRREILHYLVSEDSWTVVQMVVDELFTNRRDILLDYARTNGRTDWVWLEENISATMDESVHFQELKRDEDPYEARHDWFDEQESYSAYIACFALAWQTIRTIYPQVAPPGWFATYLPLIQNIKRVPDDIAEVARDMFLSGRDQEAIAMLAPLREGPFILWHSGFFRDVTRGTKPHIQAQLPTAAQFTVTGTYSGGTTLLDQVDDACTAIGIAMQFFTTTRQLAVVTVNLHPLTTHAWHDITVFAISNEESEIAHIEMNNHVKEVAPRR